MSTPNSALIQLYLQTEYRVHLPEGGHAVIRLDAPLPPRLARLLPATESDWGFVTAWNPHSIALPRRQNRARQHALLERLRALASTRLILGGQGLGPADEQGRRWAEASLFVIGPRPEELAALQRHFDQYAIVTGSRTNPARLST